MYYYYKSYRQDGLGIIESLKLAYEISQGE